MQTPAIGPDPISATTLSSSILVAVPVWYHAAYVAEATAAGIFGPTWEPWDINLSSGYGARFWAASNAAECDITA